MQAGGANPSPSEKPPRRNAKRVTLDQIRPLFHLPITVAAERLHVCATIVKRCCRKHGIKRWPYRKVKALQNQYDQIPTGLINALIPQPAQVPAIAASPAPPAAVQVQAPPNIVWHNHSAGGFQLPEVSELSSTGSSTTATWTSHESGVITPTMATQFISDTAMHLTPALVPMLPPPLPLQPLVLNNPIVPMSDHEIQFLYQRMIHFGLKCGIVSSQLMPNSS
eukprot:TRINITY_DN8202_c0_g1_i1.p1 TRINITY_DN8202_c0_g1~~TRINITY_DN8202_c0_g1_i1.p1  ORF type:complete len:223 (-),score=41.21 TRINITY_DN8202_c0_g1_i1:711-1379(-)